jgi:hypothetical protein
VYSISINSVALRSATCNGCERASRGPVLLVRQCPYVRDARYTGACLERPYLRACGCSGEGQSQYEFRSCGNSIRRFARQVSAKLARGRVEKSVWSKGKLITKSQRKPMSHLGLSRGDGRGACKRKCLRLDNRFTEMKSQKEPKHI